MKTRAQITKIEEDEAIQTKMKDFPDLDRSMNKLNDRKDDLKKKFERLGYSVNGWHNDEAKAFHRFQKKRKAYGEAAERPGLSFMDPTLVNMYNSITSENLSV